jgi:hypothetical protein
MADHVVRDGGFRFLHALSAIALAAAAAIAVVALTVASFDLNPVGPVFVVLAAIAGGAFLLHVLRAFLPRSAAVGLIAGGLLAILLWPLFSA